jgi:glucan-binding YG repeat protein
MVETPITPSAASNIEFFDNTIAEKKDDKVERNTSSASDITPPVTPAVEQKTNEEKESTSKPKSYRDAIGKKEKPATTSNESQPTATAKTTKSNKQQKKASKATSGNNRATRGHPQDANDYYDDSWYYGTGEDGYLTTGYTDDQEIFVGNLSAQVTENEVK